jgi:hypothetical protein
MIAAARGASSGFVLNMIFVLFCEADGFMDAEKQLPCQDLQQAFPPVDVASPQLKTTPTHPRLARHLFPRTEKNGDI